MTDSNGNGDRFEHMTPQQRRAHTQSRTETFDFLLKVAKRTDWYVRKELKRLNELWREVENE